MVDEVLRVLIFEDRHGSVDCSCGTQLEAESFDGLMLAIRTHLEEAHLDR